MKDISYGSIVTVEYVEGPRQFFVIRQDKFGAIFGRPFGTKEPERFVGHWEDFEDHHIDNANHELWSADMVG